MISPRLESSKAFTKAPVEFDEAVKALFEEHFQEEAKRGIFDSNTLIYPNEIITRVGYLEGEGIAQVNFMVSADFDSKSQDIIDTGDFILLGLKDVFTSHFTNPKREELPYVWSPVRESNETLFYKYDATNYSLENEANRLLGLEDDNTDELIVGDMDSTEDINEILDTLSRRKPTFQ